MRSNEYLMVLGAALLSLKHVLLRQGSAKLAQGIGRRVSHLLKMRRA